MCLNTARFVTSERESSMEIKEIQKKKKHWQAYESEYNQSGLIEVVFFFIGELHFSFESIDFFSFKN